MNLHSDLSALVLLTPAAVKRVGCGFAGSEMAARPTGSLVRSGFLASDNADIRLLILCAGDPEGERTFSGSARGLFAALERRGCVHHKANVLGYTDSFARGPLPVRLYRRLERRLPLRLEEWYQWSAWAFARNSARADRVARSHPGYNACLMYGTTFHPRLNVPLYCYFDATVAQVSAQKGWEFADFSPRRVQHVKDYQQLVFESCAAVLPRSRWAANSVVHDYGIAEEKVTAVGAGPNYAIAPLPHGPYDAQRILFIGSEFDRKGGPLLVEAFRKVRQSLPQATLAIVGCRPEVAGPGIEVIGRIGKDAPGGMRQLLEEYSRASVFCIMSHFEPFGIVVLEAQHCYVPCVVPSRYAFPETVMDGVTGRHTRGYDRDELAAILTELLASPERLAAMGAAAHAFVEREWTWDAAAARICARVRCHLERGKAASA